MVSLSASPADDDKLVEEITLDAYFANLKDNIQLLKIDVEGLE